MLVALPISQETPSAQIYQTPPEQRTYSEWLNSDFANGGVVFEDGRFGGSIPDDVPISSCQDCHMPPQVGGACAFWSTPPFFERDDVGAHSFAGGNTWVMNAIQTQMGMDADYYGVTDDRLDASGLAGLIEVDRPEHIAVVGHGHSRHSGLGDMRYQILDLVGAIEKRVLGMCMEVYETHGVTAIPTQSWLVVCWKHHKPLARPQRPH